MQPPRPPSFAGAAGLETLADIRIPQGVHMFAPPLALGVITIILIVVLILLLLGFFGRGRF
jgi:hypothetical protein